MPLDTKDRPGFSYNPDNDSGKKALAKGDESISKKLSNSVKKSWKPAGWDADNSGYDQSNPVSKAKIANASNEKNASISDGISSATLGAEKALSGTAKSLYTGAASFTPGRFAKLTGKITKKRATVGGGFIGVGVGLLFIFFFTLGPLKLVHMGTLLERFHFSANQDFMDGRSSNLIKFLRTGDVQSVRLGRTLTPVAKKIDADITNNTGLRSIYEPGSRRLIGYEVVDETKARPFLDEFEKDGLNTKARIDIDKVVYDGTGSNNPVRVTGDVVDLNRSDVKTKRLVSKFIVKNANIENVPSALSSRLWTRYAGVDFAPLKNLRKKATDPSLEWAANARKSIAERRAKGITEADIRAVSTDTADTNNDGAPDNPPDADINKAVADANDAIDDLSKQTNPVDPEFNKTKLSVSNKLFKAGVAASAVVGIVCGVRAIGDTAELTQYLNVVLPMIRVSTSFVSIASQIKSGENLSSDEIAIYSEDLYDPVTGLDAFAAAPFQKLINNVDSGPDLSPDLQPAKIDEKPLLFESIDKIPGIGTICGIDNTVGNLPVVKQFGDLASKGIDTALGVVGTSQEKLVGSLVNVISGQNLNYYAVGAELGNYLMYGGRLAANVLGIATGGAELTQDEESQIVARLESERKEEINNESFYARLFDTESADSLVSRTAIAVPVNLDHTSAIMRNLSITKVVNSFLPTKKASATTFDYGGLKAYGFSLAEQENLTVQDPYENALYVEAKIRSGEFDKFKECSSKQFDTNLEFIDATKNDDTRYHQTTAACNEDNSVDLLRYRTYIADRATESALACNENIATACTEIGHTSTSSQTQQPSTATNSNIFVIGDSLTVGMRDSGQLNEKLAANGWNVVGNVAKSGERLDWGNQELIINKDAVDSSGTVLVGLGTNDLGSYPDAMNTVRTQMQAIIDTINPPGLPKKKIYWTDYYGSGTLTTQYGSFDLASAYSGPGGLNQVLREVAQLNDVQIIPWSTSDVARQYVPTNDVHPNGRYPEMATFIAGGIGQAPVQTGASASGTAAVGSFKLDIQRDSATACAYVEQPGAKAIQRYVNTTWGGGLGYITNCRGTSTDSNTLSVHSEGRAVDGFFSVSNPSQLAAGNEVFGWLLTNAEAIGIQYIKFWRVQWSPSRGISCVQSASDQSNHAGHIHYELNKAGANEQTPYFTSNISAPSAVTVSQEICPIVR